MRASLPCLALFALICISPHCAAEEFQLYFGLMHGHTSFSDGSGEPGEAYDMARGAGLDFFAVTEHNHSQAAGDDGVFLTPQNYGELLTTARQKTEPGSFLAIYGQEVSTISAGNHQCVFFADEICDMPNGDFKFLYETFLPAHPEVPFIQFNHPGVRKDINSSTKPSERNNDYGIDDYGGDFDAMLAAAGDRAALIELIIGPAFSEHEDMAHQQGKHEFDYRYYLNKGFRLAPSAGQDNHSKTWGTATHARMGVWAKDLTIGAFTDAIQARRCYASEDNTASVWVLGNGRAMGSQIDRPSDDVVRLNIAVEDLDEPDAEYRIRLFYDDAVGDDVLAEVIESQTLVGNGELEFTHTASPGSYFFFKVTQTSEDIDGVVGSGHPDDIWTAPIWIRRDAPLLFAASARANTDDPQKFRIQWDEASDYLGRNVEVSGKLVRTLKFKDRAVFFNFDPDYENTLSLVILKQDFEAFGGEAEVTKLQRRLTNTDVRVSGEITLYKKERIQIRLTDPGQIRADDGDSDLSVEE